MKNLFDSDRVAEGYAACRPRFHGDVLRDLVRRTSLPAIGRALDVGCGTGLSTQPLTQIARQAVGIDHSSAMLRAARMSPSVVHTAATAEMLPFVEQSFDLITVAGAMNWIERPLFFEEARRVLRDRGWLWVYDGSEQGSMVECPAYAQWYQQQYQVRLPRPARDERPLTGEEAAEHGFELRLADAYEMQLSIDVATWVGFLMTQSCVTTAIADGRESASALQTWLSKELTPHFADAPRQMTFGGPLWCLQAG